TNAASWSTVVSVPISIQTPGGTTALAGSDRNICSASLQLDANNTAGVWSVYTGSGTFSPDAFTYNASVSGLSNGLNKFIWTTSGTCGFVSKDTVALKVGSSGLISKATTSSDTACFGSPKDIQVLVSGTGSGNYTYLWTSSDNSFNLSTTTANVTVNPVSTTTVYYLNIVDNINTGCNSGDSVKVFALADQQLVVPNLVTPNGDERNDYLEIKDENNMKILPGSSIEIVNRWGERVYKHSSYDNSWNAPNLSDGVYYYYINSGCGKRVYKGWVQIIH
ncbi:MAG TPA: gliding motility-associated C-terminal domain-containing protein, partial [Bacteroidia bacterium]|nr:gliding motility-associated C-terminal domain-containing protein [Bacteroidia bacterium]